jgi:hypothetical protein
LGDKGIQHRMTLPPPFVTVADLSGLLLGLLFQFCDLGLKGGIFRPLRFQFFFQLKEKRLRKTL